MPPGIDLSKRSQAEKDDLILRLLPLIGQLEAAHARIAICQTMARNPAVATLASPALSPSTPAGR